MPSPEISLRKEKILALIKEMENRDKDIDELERQYLAKIAKLLVMAQVHCEIKSDINNKFEKLGITHVTTEKRNIVEVDADRDSQSEKAT